MFYKIIFLASTIGVVLSNYIPHVAHSEQSISKHDDHPVVVPVGGHHGHGHQIDYHTHPKYQFNYKVVDTYTGDIKSQTEHRDGDVVKGEYAFHQPNGLERVVNYYSDDHTGFLADVKYSHTMPRYGH